MVQSTGGSVTRGENAVAILALIAWALFCVLLVVTDIQIEIAIQRAFDGADAGAACSQHGPP